MANYTRMTPSQIQRQLDAGHKPTIYDPYNDGDSPITSVIAPSGNLLGLNAHRWTVKYQEDGITMTKHMDANDFLTIEK